MEGMEGREEMGWRGERRWDGGIGGDGMEGREEMGWRGERRWDGGDKGTEKWEGRREQRNERGVIWTITKGGLFHIPTGTHSEFHPAPSPARNRPTRMRVKKAQCFGAK